MSRKAILFDADGVLLDTWDFIFGALEYTMATHNLPQPAKELVSKAMGHPLLEFYKVIVPDKDPRQFAFIHHQYQSNRFDLSKPFKGALKTLKQLRKKGYLIGVISNRTKDSLFISLKQAKLLKLVDVVISAEDVKNTKPHKEHVLYALKTLKVKPKDAVVVGDTENDILAGKNAKVKTIGVTYGFLGEDIKLLNPDFVIDNIEGLLGIIK